MSPRLKQILLLVGAAFILLIILVVLGVLPGLRSTPLSASLQFWGLDDDRQTWQPIIEAFQKQYPNVQISYQEISEVNYEDRLINALAAGKGPDIFTLKNSWITKHQDKTYPLPQSFGFSSADFKKNFVDAAADDLITSSGRIIGLPMFMDTPVLLYNKDIFNTKGIAKIPSSWEEITAVALEITDKSQTGEIINSGLALGATKNIDHFFEIISSVFLQKGDNIVNRSYSRPDLSENSAGALSFYISFADSSQKNYIWSGRAVNSLDSFAQERAAMVFALPEDIARVKAKNPHLNFAVLPFPQFTNSRPVVYGSHAFPAVSRFSRSPEAAWRFILFAAGQEGAKLYTDATSHPPARRDLLAQGAPKEELQPNFRQTLIAKSWLVPDEAGAKNIFQEAVASVLSKILTPQQAVNQIENKLRILFP